MQPNEGLTPKYNLDEIAGLSYREADNRTTVNSLSEYFNNHKSKGVGLNKTVSEIVLATKGLIDGTVYSPNLKVLVGEAYDSFEHEGIEYSSHLVEMDIPLPPENWNEGLYGYYSSKIFLISLIANNEIVISPESTKFGVICTSNGQNIFFELEANTNKGNILPSTAVKDTESGRVLATQGSIDNNELSAKPLSPYEQTQVLEEFKKALAS